MSHNEPIASTELHNLNDTDLELADPSQDIRGRDVIDSGGLNIGHVTDLFIDEDQRKVRMLEIRAGGFLGIGERHALLPADTITSIGDDGIHVNESRNRIIHSPVYDPGVIPLAARETWEPFYGYYGLSPYWGNGYLYPEFPLALEREQLVDHHSIHARDL